VEIREGRGLTEAYASGSFFPSMPTEPDKKKRVQKILDAQGDLHQILGSLWSV
jgi:hypothetical protein